MRTFKAKQDPIVEENLQKMVEHFKQPLHEIEAEATVLPFSEPKAEKPVPVEEAGYGALEWKELCEEQALEYKKLKDEVNDKTKLLKDLRIQMIKNIKKTRGTIQLGKAIITVTDTSRTSTDYDKFIEKLVALFDSRDEIMKALAECTEKKTVTKEGLPMLDIEVDEIK